jgi:hypothetical protein
MIESGKVQNAGRTKQNRFLVFLLLASVLVSSLKDLNRLQESASGLARWTSSLLRASEPASYASNWAAADRSCSQWASQKESSSDEFRWNEPAAPGPSLKIKRIIGNAHAHAATRQVVMLAMKKAWRGKPVFVTIKLPETFGRAIDSELKEDTKQ